MYLYGRFEQGIWHFVYTTMTGDLETDTPVISRVFRGGLKSSHIFIREAAAAIWGIRHALRRRHWRNVKIHLVTDNSAVAFALRSLYSSNDVVCGWIRQLAMELKDAGCTLEVEQVPSAMNPADPPSRLAAFDNDILQRGWQARLDFTKGRLTSEQHRYEDEHKGNRSRIRHGSPEDDSDTSDNSEEERCEDNRPERMSDCDSEPST